MAIRIIRLQGDPILREKAKPVSKVTPNIQRLIDDMADTMYDAEGIGLAAPQVGILKRVIVADIGEGLLGLVNPEVVLEEGEQTGPEGCLSIPGVQADVTRAHHVIVRAQDRNGEPLVVDAEGLLARCLLHEIDHLDGILFLDRVTDPRSIRRVET
ncbi:peptide deformylase [Kyrpidia spormannii]|uniref:Peptide deformylase n=2 Tax=Kyrpidia spormannii TaxID=2055160 RepID=A0A2K8N6Y8_9BACL|nr:MULTISPECIES: peptide deformylase [Kyrpidia]ATY85096.1 peptide deformylase [Kyrpidia spormannii]MCL6575937.1 peptide deformylase [Kyrpidia sp.]CAB3392690.1 peptide deformylase [Kyrpidia spormannii]CAB3393604.1 peptide deformylase [Kyrpidia spormannii]